MTKFTESTSRTSRILRSFIQATDFLWMPVCPSFCYDRQQEWLDAVKWQEGLCLLQKIDIEKCELDRVCEDGWRHEDERLAAIERKADWLLAVFAGLLGVVIHERESWSSPMPAAVACLATIPGLWLCLRTRIPSTRRPFPARAIDELQLAEKAEFRLDDSDSPSVEKLQLSIRQSTLTTKALTQIGVHLLTEWKAACLLAASKWLLISTAAAVIALLPI